MTIKDEIENYRSLNGIGLDKVDLHLKRFEDGGVDNFGEFPVCVLSHKYDPRRSKFLVNLKSEAEKGLLTHRYYIFTYSDQKDLYSQFEDTIPGVEVIYIPVEALRFQTLTGKRQYILEFLQDSIGCDNGFFIEDDCTNFCLPVGAITDKGSYKNKQFIMSYNFTFSFWESIIKNENLTYSGPMTNMGFAFRNLSENSFIVPIGQAIQAVHINVRECLVRNINFDEESGWDDYDMLIQQAIYSKGSAVLTMSYSTPALKSGVSAMSSSLEALEKRCEVNTKKLIDKWGLALVREDTKKGLYNAKVNWFNIKAGIEAGLDLTELIGKTNEEAKIIIKNRKTLSASSSLTEFM